MQPVFLQPFYAFIEDRMTITDNGKRLVPVLQCEGCNCAFPTRWWHGALRPKIADPDVPPGLETGEVMRNAHLVSLTRSARSTAPLGHELVNVLLAFSGSQFVLAGAKKLSAGSRFPRV